jgi:8-oxo-dGTP diphosphatase
MKSRKRKSAKAPVMAAGGIVLRHGARPLIAIVQRRKDDRWVLPKGKLKARESAKSAAKREAVEEIGERVIVHEFLGAIIYQSGGKPKVAHFWRMQTRDGSPRELMRDIKAVEWLSLSDASERLTHPIERTFLGEIGRRVLQAARPRSRSRRKRKAPRRKPSGRRTKTAKRGSRTHRASPNLLGRLFRGVGPGRET